MRIVHVQILSAAQDCLNPINRYASMEFNKGRVVAGADYVTGASSITAARVPRSSPTEMFASRRTKMARDLVRLRDSTRPSGIRSKISDVRTVVTIQPTS